MDTKKISRAIDLYIKKYNHVDAAHNYIDDLSLIKGYIDGTLPKIELEYLKENGCDSYEDVMNWVGLTKHDLNTCIDLMLKITKVF